MYACKYKHGDVSAMSSVLRDLFGQLLGPRYFLRNNVLGPDIATHAERDQRRIGIKEMLPVGRRM